MVRVNVAKESARRAIERQYDGICSLYNYESVKDNQTKITKKVPVCILEKEPCHVSYSKSSPVTTTDDSAIPVQTVTLFISPDIGIIPGTKITVTQNGVTADYEKSGEPAVYSSHQEVGLSLFKGWA